MQLQNRKVVIIGAGHVGSHAGFTLIAQGLVDEIVYIDVDEKKAQAQALDLADSTAYLPSRAKVRVGTYADAADAPLMIVAAGPLPDLATGQTRMDTLRQTIAIMKAVTENIQSSGFSGIIVNISNPADVVTHYIQTKLNWPSGRIFSTSTTLDSARLRRALSQATGVDQKSIVAYALVLAFDLMPELAVGMVLLGSCPSGTASNVMSFLAKGDVPLAVSITTVSTLLAPIMMPFIVWALAGQWVEVSFLAMAMTVMKVILVPLAAGLIVHKIIGEKHIASLSKVLVLVSAFGVLTIVGGVIAVNGAKILELGFFMVLIVLAHNLFGFGIGYFVTGKLGLGQRQRHSVTLEVGMQNDALAISLVSVFFAPAVAIPAAIGAAIHQVTGSILAGIFARRMDAIAARKAAVAEAVPAPAHH